MRPRVVRRRAWPPRPGGHSKSCRASPPSPAPDCIGAERRAGRVLRGVPSARGHFEPTARGWSSAPAAMRRVRCCSRRAVSDWRRPSSNPTPFQAWPTRCCGGGSTARTSAHEVGARSSRRPKALVTGTPVRPALRRSAPGRQGRSGPWRADPRAGHRRLTGRGLPWRRDAGVARRGPALGIALRVWHQSGALDAAMLEREYAARGCGHGRRFVDDMARRTSGRTSSSDGPARAPWRNCRSPGCRRCWSRWPTPRPITSRPMRPTTPPAARRSGFARRTGIASRVARQVARRAVVARAVDAHVDAARRRRDPTRRRPSSPTASD